MELVNSSLRFRSHDTMKAVVRASSHMQTKVPFLERARNLRARKAILTRLNSLHEENFGSLPTSQPSEDARLARRQRIVPRKGCSMQKHSRSTCESVRVRIFNNYSGNRRTILLDCVTSESSLALQGVSCY